jgi:GNAT superfamily N-acetyltransferase
MLEIKRAEVRHREALLELIAAYHAHDGIETTEAKRRGALVGLMSSPQFGQVWVAEQDGALLGYAVLTYDYSLECGGREGFVDELFVAASARGKGVGRMLLDRLVSAAAEQLLGGLHIVVEQENHAALAFYECCGWGRPHRVVLSRELGVSPANGQSKDNG